jgi:glycosyltransferase involved in cell wall biosynthesis
VNVLFLDQFSELGGAQRCLLDLLPAIEERGWGARVAVPRGGPLVELVRARGVQVDEIQCGPYRGGRKSFADIVRFAADVPRQAARISDLIEGADLVYVNGPRLLIAAALATRRRVPMLFHAHHSIEQTSARYVERLGLRRSNIVACCSAVAQSLRMPDGRVHVIPNGTADLGFVERRFDALRIGIVGRISPEKGQVEFLRAAALLTGARFVVCGAPLFGDRDYYHEVLRLAAGLPVEFLDWQEDVASVMRDLDVLVISSKREGMPRVLLEAFSAGVPVVAFPVGGIPEVIEDRSTGFLARGELVATLQEVLESDPETLREIAHRARREWERRYTVAKYRERIMTLMEQCVPHAAGETAAPQWHRSATRR